MVPSEPRVVNPKNARGRPVTKLCLALETFRRTDEGRIRDAKAFLTHFFPQDKQGAKDRIFLHMPNEVRADLLSNWGIRGKKSALRDDDDRVRNTVNDALNAGDIDFTVIEEGITPEILIDWVPLEDWWLFWRGSNLPIGSVRKALALARDLSLFDERWFFEHLALKSAKLVGTDVVCNALSKEQIVAWMHAIHASGDASPTGLVAAIGWETILAKTAHEGLLFALDALARQIGLAESGPDDRKSDMPRPLSEVPPTSEPPTKPTQQTVPEHTSPRAKSEPPPNAPIIPEPPPTPRTGVGGAHEHDVPARTSARPPEPVTPEPPVTATDAPPPAFEASPPVVPPPSRPPVQHSPLPKPSVPPPKPPPPPEQKPVSTKPPVPTSTKTPDSSSGKPPPVPQKPPPPQPQASKAPPVPQKQPPPVPAAASKAPPQPPPAPAASKPPARSVAPVQQDLPSVIIEEDPFFPAPPPAASQVPAPPSAPPNARALFLGAAAEPPPMRPPAATIVGVAPQAQYGLGPTDDVAMPNFTVPPVDPDWAPQRAEPGDMGWDLVHGVTRPMGTNVQPKYNFEDDDEPTSEINLPTDMRRQQ